MDPGLTSWHGWYRRGKAPPNGLQRSVSGSHWPGPAWCLAVAVAWKQRLQFRTVETTAPGGERTQAQVPRLSVVDHLTTVRSFYLDIAEWAAREDLQAQRMGQRGE